MSEQVNQAAHIIIVGAGIGGLTTALALARRGYSCEVLESTREIAAIGAGVTLAPNAMRVYGHLGVATAIEVAGVEPTQQRVQHWADGRTLVAFERGSKVRDAYGAPYIYIHRADLHDILYRAAMATGRVTVRLGARVTGATITSDQSCVHLDGGDQVIGDLIIAADGVKSILRARVAQDLPQFSGHIVWRAIVDVTAGPFSDLSDFPGIHIGPGRMAVRYPICQGRKLNLVFFARQSGWAEEGWAIPAHPDELSATFRDWCPEVQSMIAAIEPDKMFKWAIFARAPLPRWTSGGRLCLLGDAAHATTPFLGQGAAAAIEDAFVLARALDASPDIATAIARYEAVRQPHCDLVQRESNANADRLQGPESDLYGMTKLVNEESLGLFAYDVAAINV